MFVAQSQSKDDDASKLHFQIEELKEQNEVLEFRTLELEEQVEKVRKTTSMSLCFVFPFFSPICGEGLNMK